jgi:methionyl-tRNA formyltransferase
MKCVVFAYSQLGHDCLQYILTKTPYQVAAVFTHEDAASETIWFDSVANLAHAHRIPVFTPTSLKGDDVLQTIQDLAPDLILSFYYRNMIPSRILSIAPLGAYNMHGSLLPKYRGRAPVNWAILNGETETGVTLHAMVAAADAGDIVDQAETPISLSDTAGQVMQRLNGLAVAVLARALPRLVDGSAVLTPQDHAAATYFGGRTAADGAIDWSWPAKRIYDLVRALQPSPQYPPATAQVNGARYAILGCAFETPVVFQNDEHTSEKSLHTADVSNQQDLADVSAQHALTPGSVLQVNGNDWLIACGEIGADRVWVTAAALG